MRCYHKSRNPLKKYGIEASDLTLPMTIRAVDNHVAMQNPDLRGVYPGGNAGLDRMDSNISAECARIGAEGRVSIRELKCRVLSARSECESGGLASDRL